MGDAAVSVIADRYTLERMLGEGGMASVWLARDLRHDRPVAIKVIRSELAGAIGVDRFLREVQLTARLQHPNIVPLLDSGVLPAADGTRLPWYAMPYLAGESLRDRLARERQLPIAEALRITGAVAAALQVAHRQGVVHRDIKPENVLLTADGNVYVVDFGLAKAVADTATNRLTSTGLSVGTPAYMSPEQAAGDPVDARTDQCALATVLYEMLAGEVPFGGSTAQAILARRLSEPARPIRPLRSTVPAHVEHAVLRALERTPADRYPDVDAFVAALHTPVAAAPRPPRRVLVLSLGAAGLVGLVALALNVAPPRGAARGSARDSTVVAFYTRGMQGLAKRTDEGASEALTSFRAALARDSTYGPAWAGLAQTYQQAYGRRFVFSGAEGDSVLRLAVAASDRATALDGRNPEVLYTQALVGRQLDPTDLGPAIRALRQAVAAEPRSARYRHHLAIALYDSGERDEAIREWRRAVELDPAYTEGLAFLALGYMWARQYDSAARWADSAVVVNPAYLLARQVHGNIELERGNHQRAAADFEASRRLSSGVEVPNALAGSALVAARAGRGPEAARLLAQVESLMVAYTPVPLHNAVYIAAAYAALGDRERAVGWIERYSPHAGLHFQLHLRCDPPLDPLADDPRFRALLRAPRPEAGRGC